MSRVLDPAQETPNWLPQVRCEDCDAPLDAEPGYFAGSLPRVCRPCQNKRYEAKIAGTPQGETRKRRKALLAKKRRLESRIESDRAELAGVLLELVRARGLAALAVAGCSAAIAVLLGAVSWDWVGAAAVWQGVSLQLLCALAWVRAEIGDGTEELVLGPYAASWALVLGGFLLQRELLFRLLAAAASIGLAPLAPGLP